MVIFHEEIPPKERKKKSAVKKRYYAVRRGRQAGVFTDAAQFMDQIQGFQGAEGKSFPSRKKAEEWIRGEETSTPPKMGAGRKKNTTPSAAASQPLPPESVSHEEIVRRELPRSGPKSLFVTSKEWFLEITMGAGSDGVYAIWSNLDSQSRRQFELDFWRRLESRMISLATERMPLPRDDALIEQAKRGLVKEMERWNPPANRRSGFSKQLGGANWSFSLKAFGSYASRLHTRGSDIDLQIDGTFFIPTERKTKHAFEMSRADAKKLIHVFGARLSNATQKYHVEKIPNARMPILKVKDVLHGVSCDIAFPNGSTVDWPKSELLLVLNYIDYRLHYVLTLVKIWAETSQLRDASLGRFNTYTLTSLIVFYFQKQDIFPPLKELITPQLIRAAEQYDDITSHIADMARRAKQWRGKRSQTKENTEGVMELFLGFLAWLGDTLNDVLGYGDKSMRAPLKIMTYSATCCANQGSDGSGEVKLLHVADPFDLDDNSARALSLKCITHAARCASETLSSLGDLDVDAWIQFAFKKVNAAPGRTNSRRSRRR